MANSIDNIRGAVHGAGRAFQVIEGGGGGRLPPAHIDAEECPLVALGHLDGVFHFLDVDGQKRALSARQLGQRNDLLSLFLGDEKWLRRKFPRTIKSRRTVDGQEIEEDVVVDFQLNRAGAWMQNYCRGAGLFGQHVVLRRPGVWAGEDGLPIVHCGDCVLVGDTLHAAGLRVAGQVWAAAAPTPRPATPCDGSVARELQKNLRDLWRFRKVGAEIAVLGLLGTAYYGAAAPWRSGGFIIGGAGSGKTSLLQTMIACCPMHHYTTDTSKAGLEAAVNGRAMPSFVEEAGDREDQRAARALMDVVLSASGGSGTKGHRANADGTVRQFELVGAIIMAAISPPDLKPQHLGRFTLIELMSPEDGADHSDQHRALTAHMRHQGPALWGRALSSFERYLASLKVFRAALGEHGCAPREMDQLGALMAGWWMLTEESVPDAMGGKIGIGALTEFVRQADDVAEDSSPRRMLQHLLSSMVQMDRSTDRRQVGQLIWLALRRYADGNEIDPGHARRVLSNYGIRPIRHDEMPDARGRPVPRAAHGSGVWFMPKAAELRRIFANTEFDGDRWHYDLRRLESAREKQQVHIGGLSARSVWVSAEELGFEVDGEAPSGDVAS